MITMTPPAGFIDDDWRRFIILSSPSSALWWTKSPSMTTTTTMWTKTSTNTEKQNIQIYGDCNNAIDVIAFVERSIENHLESVLSTNHEREQGQSGDHIWRPYTGAEKGPKEARFAHLRHAGPTATSGPHQHRQHRARHDYFRWATTAPGIGDRLNRDDHENRSRSSVCDNALIMHYHTPTLTYKLTAVLLHTCAR